MTTHAEKCKVIAEAIGKDRPSINEYGCVLIGHPIAKSFRFPYNPLTNDAQNHELIRVFKIDVQQRGGIVYASIVNVVNEASRESLNTAVFECAYKAVIAGWKL